MTDIERPDWLKPGAEVVIWTDDYGYRVLAVSRATVAKVATKTFTVEGVTGRFAMDTLRMKSAGMWDRGRFCAHVDSEQGRAVLEKQRHQLLAHRARNAVETWNRVRTRDNRLTAIAALQAIEVDEEG